MFFLNLNCFLSVWVSTKGKTNTGMQNVFNIKNKMWGIGYEDMKFDTKQINFTFLDVTTYDSPRTSTANTHEQDLSTSSIKSSTSKGHIKSKLIIHFMLINLGKVLYKK